MVKMTKMMEIGRMQSQRSQDEYWRKEVDQELERELYSCENHLQLVQIYLKEAA